MTIAGDPKILMIGFSVELIIDVAIEVKFGLLRIHPVSVIKSILLIYLSRIVFPNKYTVGCYLKLDRLVISSGLFRDYIYIYIYIYLCRCLSLIV